MLILQACLEESDNTALCLTGTNQQDVGLAALGSGVLQAVYQQLVCRNDGDSSPGYKCTACDIYNYRRYSTLGAFSFKCSDGAGMCQEERGLLPYLGDQLIQIIRCGCAISGLDPLGISDILQKTIIIIVDQLALLTLTQRLNGET